MIHSIKQKRGYSPLFCFIGNSFEFPMKQKHYVQRMRTRTRRNYCFAIVLSADKKAALFIVFVARVCEAHFLV